MIQYAGETKAIPLNNIYYMESQNHNIVLFLKSGKLEYYGKIGDLEEKPAGKLHSASVPLYVSWADHIHFLLYDIICGNDGYSIQAQKRGSCNGMADVLLLSVLNFVGAWLQR